ncbi:MAG: sensor histidine kinase, partial [Actinomycetota bacterium]|nr:sensor histidine kinase [Actinomycetota bacterium]
LSQILRNLAENGLKFSPADSPVDITMDVQDSILSLAVTDRGPGIPKEDRRRIFEPFERGSTTASGTGLGLAVADAIVQAHGGRLWASQAPTGGAAFTFELPCEPDINVEGVNGVGASAGR